MANSRKRSGGIRSGQPRGEYRDFSEDESAMERWGEAGYAGGLLLDVDLIQ